MNFESLWLIKCDKPFFTKISTHIGSHFKSFCILNELDAIRKFQDFLSIIQSSSFVTILVFPENISFLEIFTKSLVRHKNIDKLFKIIFISDFLTWAGMNKEITDPKLHIDQLFLNRIPLPNSRPIYLIENFLYKLRQADSIDLKIILYGTIYGDFGYNFQAIFKDFWLERLNYEILPSHLIPLISIDSFLCILMDSIQNSSENIFLRAFELPNESLKTSFERILNNFNIQNFSNNQIINFETLNLSNFLNSELLRLEIDETYSFLSNFSTIYEDFKSINGYNPVFITIIGPPCSGKTNFSKDLSQILKIPYLNCLEAVLYVLRYEIPNNSSSRMLNIKEALIFKEDFERFIEAKLAEMKKGKDKGQLEIKIDFNLLTDSFCASLEKEYLHSCLAFIAVTNKDILKKGVILDVWEKNIFKNMDEVMNTLNKYFDPVPSKVASCYLEIISSESILIEKIQQSMNTTIKSKEGQILFKQIETSVSAYFKCTNADNKLESLVDYQTSHPESVVIRIDSNIQPKLDLNIYSLKKDLEEKFGKSLAWLESSINENSTLPELTNDVSHLPEKEEKQEIIVDLKENYPKIITENLKIDGFLTNTILPTLANGLVKIKRERPVDPIKVLASFLQSASVDHNFSENIRAKEYFKNLL